jgi:5'-deoxynucleotidase YfbR-like HD superfamily hydrolase
MLESTSLTNELQRAEIISDIDTVLWGMKLYKIRRFWKQKFWERESLEAEFADRLEPFPRLESVAEHSWHVADTVLLLGGHFETLDVDKSVRLAILHDKMEILIGDRSPVGRHGTGASTHAFNLEKKLSKDESERRAVAHYVGRLRLAVRNSQRSDLLELLDGHTREVKFVKAVDKLQALAFVLLKKRGAFEDAHLRFTLRYSGKCLDYFPELQPHYDELKNRLLLQVARRRQMPVARVIETLRDRQLTFFDDFVPEEYSEPSQVSEDE